RLAPRRGVGAGLRAGAPALGHRRLPVLGGRRPPHEPPPTQPPRAHARARCPAPHGRAAGDHRRARARQDRVPDRHERESFLSVRLLEEMSSPAVSRRYGITMASFTGHLAWQFLRGRYLDKIEAALGRPLDDDDRQAFAEDAHGGWWETSLMLLVRPDLVDGVYRTLPPARYSLAARAIPNYPLKSGGQGYVGHPAMADPAFAKAVTEVLINETMALVEGLLDGRIRPADRRSPFFALPFFRTDFWPLATTALAFVAVGAIALLFKRSNR